MYEFLKYHIIIPAHNEEKHIGKMLHSVVGQTYLPARVVVVNDNSSDSTEEIVRSFCEKYDFITVINSNQTRTGHLPGSKVIEAFYKGFEQLENDWDIIVKLDADVILPPNYFEEVVTKFRSNPKIGIAGGIAMTEQNGKWRHEKIGNKKQVRGPFKAYSKSCFDKIGGLKKSIAWDTVDELLAIYYGFEIRILPHLEVRLQKPTGSNYKKIHGKKIGEGFYKMDYGWFISLVAALKAAWLRKSAALFLNISKGYWSSFLHSDSKIVTKEEGRFIRRYRMTGILKRFLNRA